MKIFHQDINKDSREKMIGFLSNHFRYNTMNSWNRATSYANNLKFYNLGLDDETVSRLHDLFDCDGFYDTINDLIQDFNAEHDYEWQAGFNGRSGGYLVLYQGKYVPSGYKSYCPSCGQKNYTSITENNGKCGVCKGDRVDYTKTHMSVQMFPGRGTDEDKDYKDWELYQLRDRVELIQSFDKLADAIVEEAVYLAENYESIEEEYFEKKTKFVLVERIA